MTRPTTTATARSIRAAGAITQVGGIEVGHFSDSRRPTGCTVIIAREGAAGGGDINRSEKTGVRRQKSEVRSQKTEVRRQKSEDRSQKTEVRRQK